ncbi:MAG: flagellar hook-associated protein FlgL [Oligoflexia bacterium]|nr:flagellar hook-associated protein FlgL [Oligoflexia bacterium]
MRVTQSTNYDTIRDSIHRSRNRMEGLQQQSATLKKLNTPSDDPVGASKVLEIRTDKVNNDQFQTNAKIAETYLNNSDHALGELADLVVRAKEIAIGQSSGASSNEDTRLGIAEEVTQLYQQAVATANRRIGERYLFGGYKTQQPPVDADGRYHGDDGQMMTEIAKGVFLAMNVHGAEAFNTNPKEAIRELHDSPEYTGDGVQRAPAGIEADNSSENINIFDELQNLRIALLAGDTDGIRNTLERFDDLHSRMIAMRAKVGSRIQGLQSMSQSTERHNITNAQLSSALEDADMAQVVSDLAKEETIFRSALASSQKLIQPTLLDFLK